jgi:hypothetical protein
MIMYDLIERTQSEVRTAPALTMVESGPYWTADFKGLDDSFVIVFWTVDSEGKTAMVWEHTMGYLPAITPTGAVRLMNDPA